MSPGPIGSRGASRDGISEKLRRMERESKLNMYIEMDGHGRIIPPEEVRGVEGRILLIDRQPKSQMAYAPPPTRPCAAITRPCGASGNMV